MIQLLIISLIILFVVSLAGMLTFWYSRNILREAKNYERGLKMVPLRIHLPPSSEDLEGGNRDYRDVVNENISKSEVLYNIISTTAQKGFKSDFFGQRHISFEIVASGGFVYFYAAVPLALAAVVEQAILSAYPTARIEETTDHNLFNKNAGGSGTIGGELVLKEDYAFPVASYKDIKRDPMQSMLGALAALENEDGAGIQLLLRPAKQTWVKHATSVASSKSKGEKVSTNTSFFSGLNSWWPQVFQAFWKPPEQGESSSSKTETKEVSGTDQAIIAAIEEKASQAGYEVLIRVVVSSNMTQRAQAILSNIIASFALYDSPGRNGFKHVSAKDIDEFVTSYILRIFPPERNKDILSTNELASLFHFPDQDNIPTTQLERQASKQVDGPRNMAEDGLLLGYNVFRGSKKKILLSPEDRMRHMYIVGQTGVGKSVLLENLALQDMLGGKSFAFIDPHGDSAEKLLSMVPKERTEDVIYFCPADMEHPMGLNLFEFDNPDQKDFLVQESINILYKLYDPQRQGIIGPRYEHLFRNAALAIMADPAGGTFIDIPRLFSDRAYVNRKLKHVTDKNVLDFWLREMPDAQRSNEFGDMKSWFISKFSAFMGNDMMRNIIGQTESSFNMREIMDEGKILIVNLSKGRTGELNMKLLGMLFVIKFQMAAMSRANIPESDRKDFTLFVDEFQNFATESFSSILSEARKYRLSVVVANQFTTQLQEDVRDAIYGNVGTAVSFRLSAQDAENMVRQFYSPIFEIDDMTRLPIGNVAIRMLIHGVPSQPFSMQTLPMLGHVNTKLKEALQELSWAKYGRPRAQVEKEIFERVDPKTFKDAEKAAIDRPISGASEPTIADPRTTGPQQQAQVAGAGPSNPQALTGGPPNKGQPAKSKGFLDEWLDRRAGGNPPNKPGANQPNQAAQGQTNSQLPKPVDNQSAPTAPAAASNLPPANQAAAVQGAPQAAPAQPASAPATNVNPFAAPAPPQQATQSSAPTPTAPQAPQAPVQPTLDSNQAQEASAPPNHAPAPPAASSSAPTHTSAASSAQSLPQTNQQQSSGDSANQDEPKDAKDDASKQNKKQKHKGKKAKQKDSKKDSAKKPQANESSKPKDKQAGENKSKEAQNNELAQPTNTDDKDLDNVLNSKKDLSKLPQPEDQKDARPQSPDEGHFKHDDVIHLN